MALLSLVLTKRKMIEDDDDDQIKMNNKTLNLSDLEIKDNDPRKLTAEFLEDYFETKDSKISRVQLRNLICKKYTGYNYDIIHDLGYKNHKVKNLDHLSGKERSYVEFYHDIDVFMMKLKSLSFNYNQVYDIILNKKYTAFYKEYHKKEIEQIFYQKLHMDKKEEDQVNDEL